MNDRPARDRPPGSGRQTPTASSSVSELHDHTVAGRLSTEELEDRLQAAYTARTTAELDALRRDLPRTDRQLAAAHAARRSHLIRRMIQESGGSLVLFVVCSGVWLATEGHSHGSFWPVWVLVVFVISVARNGWALFGPAPDLDAVERRWRPGASIAPLVTSDAAAII